MSKKNDLKAALKRLKVHEPLRLKEPSSSVQKEAPPSEVPQADLSIHPTNEETQSEAPSFKEPKSETVQCEQPQTENAASEFTHRKVAQTKRTQNEVPKSESPQDGELQIQLPQNEIPPNEETTTSRGFFKLAHAVFEDPRLREISGDCFRLYLWFSAKAWRFPQSNGTLRASVRYINEGTGIPHATVSRALSTLKDKKLIKLLESNYKKGNRWYISKYAVGDGGPAGGQSQSELPHIEKTQNAQVAASDRGSRSLKLSKQFPQNGSNIRSFNKTKNLQKQRKPKRENAATSVPKECIPALHSVQEGHENCSAEKDYVVAIEAFERDLESGLRSKLINNYVQEKFPHGFLPPDGVVRRLTALAWFRENANGVGKAIGA